MNLNLNGRSVEVRLFQFDLDGIVVDSERLPKAIWYAVYQTLVNLGEVKAKAEVGIQTFFRFNGLTSSEIQNAAIEIFDSQENFALAKSIRNTVCSDYISRIGYQPMPGVTDALAAIVTAGVPKVVATASAFESAMAKLRSAKLDGHFDQVISCAEFESKARGFSLAATKFKVPIENCLVIGDAPADVACAIEVGANVVAIPDLCHPELFESFRENSLFLGFTTMALLAEAIQNT